MKNFEFTDASAVVLTKQATTEQKTRTLKPDFALVKKGLEHKQETEYPLISDDNLFVVGDMELNIATTVKAIVIRMRNKNDKPVIQRSYKVIQDVAQVNGKDTVIHKFLRFSPSVNQKKAIESAQKAPLKFAILTE